MSEEIHIVPSSTWMPPGQGPVIIAGPCSAESEEQIITVAEQLAKDDRVRLIRAGVWKPRTRPNSFEGMGAQALPWLRKATEAFGKPFIIEVANAEHVRMALDAGIEHVWVGARTTVNPFSVQEIADALEGKDIPVLVKNPLNPDLQLWMGALERFSKAGLHKLMAIHRGFSTYKDQGYRNAPNWDIPIELKTKLPNIEILVDPSHISGKQSLVQEVSQRAFDLAFDGLMVETHPNPDEALSDPKQQWFLSDFGSFLDGLETRTRSSEEGFRSDRLVQLRALIDEVDHEIINTLKRRMEIVEDLGQYKSDSGIAIFQLERWLDILCDRTEHGRKVDLDPDLIQAIWKAIHNASIRRQSEIVQAKTEEHDIFGI